MGLTNTPSDLLQSTAERAELDRMVGAIQRMLGDN
jgi:hypothetical protein